MTNTINKMDLPRHQLAKVYSLEKNKIKNKDKLDFFPISNDFLKEIFNEQLGISKLNLIQGPRGCGKTTFTKILLLNLREQSTKKFIPIIFNPWYLDTKKIDESFFELLTNELLQYKRSNNLKKSTDSLLRTINSIDNPRIKLISNFINIHKDKEQSIDSKIYEIAEIINKEYNNIQIAIWIDEIDRLDQNKLMEIGQLLDIIKRLTELCKGKQCISFFSRNNGYIKNINLPGSNDNKNNFETYFSRFKFSTINIYQKTISKLTEFVINKMNINITNEDNLNFEKEKIKATINILEQNEISFVMRNANSLFFFRENAIGGYIKNKEIDEVKINKIITEEIQIAFLYFGNIYFERYSKYPHNLDSEITFHNGETKDKKELFKTFKEDHEYFCKLQQIDESNFSRWIEDSFKYVNGLINRDFNIFKEKEKDELNKYLKELFLKHKVEQVYELIKKYKDKIYFNPSNYLNTLYRDISYDKDGVNEDNKNRIIELTNKIIEKRNFFCIRDDLNYNDIDRNIGNLINPIIKYLNYYIKKDDVEIQPKITPDFNLILNKIDEIKNNLIKIHLYMKIYYHQNYNGFDSFQKFCKNELDNKEEKIKIKGINFSYHNFFQKKLLNHIKEIFDTNSTLEKMIEANYKKLNGKNISEKDKLLTINSIFDILNDFDDGDTKPRKIRNLFSDKTKLQLLYYPIETDDNNFLFNQRKKYNIKEIKLMYEELEKNNTLLEETYIYLYQIVGGTNDHQLFKGDKNKLKNRLGKQLEEIK